MPMRRLSLATAVLAGLCGCIAATAAAEPAAVARADIEGRWQDKRRGLLLDVRACGERICGRLVSGGTCGATVLEAGWRARSLYGPGEEQAVGTLDLPASRERYHVNLALFRKASDGTLKLRVVGTYDSEPGILRRVFPLDLMLVRTGDAACTPRPTS